MFLVASQLLATLTGRMPAREASETIVQSVHVRLLTDAI